LNCLDGCLTSTKARKGQVYSKGTLRDDSVKIKVLKDFSTNKIASKNCKTKLIRSQIIIDFKLNFKFCCYLILNTCRLS